MTTLYEGAFAKVNLTLDVLGKREDGYHDLQSVMQTISVRDDVEIDVGTGKPWVLTCTDPEIPTDESNLAWKAAKVFCETLKKDPGGLAIRILKRIPSGAGLGGGSADAAAVLRALNRYYDALYPLWHWQSWVRWWEATCPSAYWAERLWWRAEASGCGSCRICRIVPS